MYDGPEFRHLRYFVAVAEECNFGRAAQRLHVSQPSLSAQIKQLEEGMRATLFLRSRAGAELTAAGRAFLPEAKRLLQMRERAVQTTSSVHAGIDLPLRFGYSPFINHHLIEEAVLGYRALVPSGRVEPRSECSGPLIAMIADGHLDAALVSMPLGEQNLFVQRVCVERLMVCLRLDDLLAREESIPRSLIGDRLRVLFARAYHPLFYDELTRKFAKAKIRLSPTEFVSSPADVQFLVKIGAGLGLVRESVPLDPELTRRSIAGLPLHVKTALICHPAQQRPVLPLLAYRLARLCADEAEVKSSKRPNSGVAVVLPTQLPIFG